MEAYFVIFCAVIIPLFFVYQPTDGRNYLFSIGVGLYVGWLAIKSVFGLSQIVLNASDIILICFGFFYFMSSSWAPNQREGTTTAITWVSGIILYFTIRHVSTELVMLALYVPVLVMIPMVAYQIYSKYRYGGTIEVDGNKLASDAYGVFGNTNYLGVYLSIAFFPGLWLWANVSPWFVIPQILICIIIYLTKCSAAWIALICGIALALLLNGCYILCSVLMLIAIAVIIVKLFERKIIREAAIGVSDRFYWSLMALNLIRKKPLFGWGPRAYSIEQNNSMREVIPQSKFPSFTDYVHNDWLEIFVETGVVGFSMFGLFIYFLPWQADPFISGGLAAMLVSSLFFFSFYKAHTFVLFWCLAGLNAGQGMGFNIPWPILTVLALGFLALVYQYPFKKLLSIIYWMHKAFNSKGKEDFVHTVVTKCLKNDPYNSLYLSAVYHEVATINSQLALNCAVRMSEHFDGITSFKFVEKIQPKIKKGE